LSLLEFKLWTIHPTALSLYQLLETIINIITYALTVLKLSVDTIRSQATDLKVMNFVNIVTLQVPAHRTNTVMNCMHSHYMTVALYWCAELQKRPQILNRHFKWP